MSAKRPRGREGRANGQDYCTGPGRRCKIRGPVKAMRWRGGDSCEKGCKALSFNIAVGLGEGSAVGKTSRRKRIKGTLAGACMRSGRKDEGARKSRC